LSKKKTKNQADAGRSKVLTAEQKGEILGLIHIGFSLLIALAFVLQHVGNWKPESNLLSQALWFASSKIGFGVLVVSLMFWTWGLERIRGLKKKPLFLELTVWGLLGAVVVVASEVFGGYGGRMGQIVTSVVLMPFLGEAGTLVVLTVITLISLILVLDITLLPWGNLMIRLSALLAAKLYLVCITVAAAVGRCAVFLWNKICAAARALRRKGPVEAAGSAEVLMIAPGITTTEPEGDSIDFIYPGTFEPSPVADTVVSTSSRTEVDESVPLEHQEGGGGGTFQDLEEEFALDGGMEVTVYNLPSSDVLDPVESIENEAVKELVQKGSEILLETLKHFKIDAVCSRADVGPSVVRYELKIPPGIKVSKITGLQDNIALALATNKVRIEAPIPGKSAIGVEVPNPAPSIVYFREIMESETFTRDTSLLKFVVGKTITGEPVVADLTRMPHLLIGGATNSGKSVCLHSVIASFLFVSKPEQVRFIMIDPKMVELSFYNDIPHLLTPVVTDPRLASTALKWAVREMEARYQLLKQYRVKNIDGFNLLVKAMSEAEEAQSVLEAREEEDTRLVMEDYATSASATSSNATSADAISAETIGADGGVADGGVADGGVADGGGYEEEYEEKGNVFSVADDDDDKPDDLEPLYYIVIIIDEMADLMMMASREIEETICRLAQKARAVGIHLVLATQRPSVDVITGLIKANLPSRIAFAVSSQTDSRTIMDRKGAESLLGRGDMLYSPLGKPPVRVQGSLIKDDEIERLVEHLKVQGEPEYVEEVTLEIDDDDDIDVVKVGGDKEDMSHRAALLVISAQHASTSLLQRKLRIGYGRAARIIDELEEKGVIGPFNESRRKRDVLMTMDEYKRRFMNGA